MAVNSPLTENLLAVLERGARCDFIDLYSTLHQQSLGITDCLAALRGMSPKDQDEILLLRALTYFDDAEREASLPGEGKKDWAVVKDFFLTRVGNLLTPPTRPLEIQGRVGDVICYSGSDPD